MPAGQLSNVSAAIPGGGPGHANTMVFFNTDTVNNIVTLTYTPTGGTVQNLIVFTLAPGEQAVMAGLPADIGGALKGSATNNNKVNWTQFAAPDAGPFTFQIFDANGLPKNPAAVLAPSKITTINVTTGTMAAGVASGAQSVFVKSTNAVPGAQAMRTPAQILADTPGLQIGMSYDLRITQTGAGTLTLATDSGAGFTMTGTMTVPTNTFRDFVVTITGATTGTVEAVGTGTYS